MQAQISFCDLNYETTNPIPDNIIKFSVEKVSENLRCETSDKPKPQVANSVKTLEEIEKIKKYFLDRKEYRNYCLFIIGITTGYRISDLLSLKFSDFFKDYSVNLRDQPNLCYTDNHSMEEFVNRTPDEYYNWIKNCDIEVAPIEI